MLIIKNSQLEFSAEQKRAKFIDRMLPHLEAEYPSWYRELQPDEVRQFVHRVIEFGKKHGVRSAWAVSTLVELSVEFGERFEKSYDSVWAVQLLMHPRLPDQIKVGMLSEKLRERTGGRRIVEIEAATG